MVRSRWGLSPRYAHCPRACAASHVRLHGMLHRLSALSALLLACGGSASAPTEPAPRAAPGSPAASEVPGSAVPVPSPPSASATASSHCVDLAAAAPCEAGSWPQPPTPLVRASELGGGFRFVSLNGNTALAEGVPYPKAVIIEPEGIQVVELFDPDADPNVGWLMVDAVHSRRFETSRLIVLGCSSLPSEGGGRSCQTFSAERDPSSGRFGRLAQWEIMSPAWQLRGLIDVLGDGSEPFELCVYGRGIHCRQLDGSWPSALVPERGLISAVSPDLLALTDSGALLTARVLGGTRDLLTWDEVPTSAPLDRVSAAGGLNDAGLWVKRADDGFQECNQQPLLRAGDGTFDALDASGTPYVRQAQAPDTRYELCKLPSVMPGAVLGEAYLSCGIARNWVALTSEAVFAMTGSVTCAYD